MRQRNLLTVEIAGRAGRRGPLLLLARLPSRVPGGAAAQEVASHEIQSYPLGVCFARGDR
jgi:hypothetical protein